MENSPWQNPSASRQNRPPNAVGVANQRMTTPTLGGLIETTRATDDLSDVIEGSLETKVPTIWTDEKQHSQEEAEPGRNSDV